MEIANLIVILIIGLCVINVAAGLISVSDSSTIIISIVILAAGVALSAGSGYLLLKNINISILDSEKEFSDTVINISKELGVEKEDLIVEKIKNSNPSYEVKQNEKLYKITTQEETYIFKISNRKVVSSTLVK